MLLYSQRKSNKDTEALVKRLVSEDYRDKVIVTTIQKLGLALDDDSRQNKEKKKKGELTYKERLAPLKDSRIIISKIIGVHLSPKKMQEVR